MQLLGWICNPTTRYIIIFNALIAQATHNPTPHASHHLFPERATPISRWHRPRQ
jgi:hypothetical protein